LAHEITFVTNSFYLHPIVSPSWQPSYYCLSDPIYFNGSVPLTQFQAITERVTTATFFVPHWAREFITDNRALPADRTYYVAGADQTTRLSVAPVDLTNVTIGVQTVVQMAILAAMYMGCSRIYLLGFDHDWLAHGGTHVTFYNDQDITNQWSYGAMLDAVTKMWRIYEKLQRVADLRGTRIVNVTGGGFLDIFERDSYESVIEEKVLR
jgi:hypothetical protein